MLLASLVFINAIFTTVFLVFLILKLINIIAWSWLIISSPLILSFILGVVLIVVNYIHTIRYERWQDEIREQLLTSWAEQIERGNE